MNRRQTKKKKALAHALKTVVAPKVEPKQEDVATLVGEIVMLCQRINVQTEFCVFAYYSGHVRKDDEGVYQGLLDFDISRTKEEWATKIVKMDLHLDNRWGHDPIASLKHTKANLQYILDHGELPTEWEA